MNLRKFGVNPLLLALLGLCFAFAGQPALAQTLDFPHIAVVQDNGNNILNNPKGGALPLSNASKGLYGLHAADDFDFIFVFMKVGSTAADEKYMPSGIAVSQAPAGTGAPAPAQGPSYYGSQGRLKAIGSMYSIDNYTASSNDAYISYSESGPLGGKIPVPSGYSQVSVVARAMMAYWGNYLQGLGEYRAGNFWSFYGETYYSPLGGNHFDAGYPDNEFMVVTSKARRLGNLDLYLMGLKTQTDIENDLENKFFYGTGMSAVGTGATLHDPSDCSDAEGGMYRGTRHKITIADIVSANGAVAAASQTAYRCAFVYVVPRSVTAAAMDLSKLDGLRKSFQTWVNTQTKGQFTMDCRIDTSVQEDGDADTNCTTGDRRCNGSKIETCNTKGEYVYTSDCVPKSCVDGACVDPSDGDADKEAECTNGKSRCKPSTVNGQACTEDAECGDDISHCAEGHCRASIIEACSNGSWLPLQDCWSDGQVCDAAACVEFSAVDGDDNPNLDGDTDSADKDPDQRVCETAYDCPESQRCTANGACLPCPTGKVVDVENNTCVDIAPTENGGGGGCRQSPAPLAMSLVFLGLGVLLLLRKRENV